MTEFPSLRRLNVSYTLVHVVYWAMFAIFAGYQTSLLLGRGFTSGEAGIFASIRCFAGILAQPLLGGWADRHPEVPIKRLLNACLVLALGVNVVFYTTRPGFWGTALIFLTLGILELNAYPLLDSMAVQFIAAGVDMSYSLSRGLGSLPGHCRRAGACWCSPPTQSLSAPSAAARRRNASSTTACSNATPSSTTEAQRQSQTKVKRQERSPLTVLIFHLFTLISYFAKGGLSCAMSF